MVAKEQVEKFFREKSRKPLGFREIVFLMGLKPPEARRLRKLLRQMVEGGELVLTRKGLYGSAKEMDLLTGYFEAHRDGFGFVVQEKPGLKDLFIPPRATGSAMDRDRVVARVEDVRRGSGRIIRILQRAHKRITGTLETAGGAYYVRPRRRTVTFDVHIAPGDRGGARKGQAVVAEISEYPSYGRPSSGKVVKVFERPEEPRTEVEAVIEEFGLPRRFPRAVLNDARVLSEKAPGRREDLRGLITVTIDGERARDFDDALSIGLDGRGYTLRVHIADVGFYVGWDTPLDLEARKRGSSVYFPDRVIPMLPKELSEDLCSLRPGVDRAAFTVEMSFDRQGGRLGCRFYPSLIKSDGRMTYTSVRKILVDMDEKERGKHGRLLHDLELMGELAGILRDMRLKRGSLDFDLPEPEILLDVQGRPEAILRAERNFAHMLVEEFMIAANEAVAEHLEAGGVPSLYRIHEEPDPDKLEDVMKLARARFRKQKDLRPKMLHKILDAFRGAKEEEVITYMVLRSLKQARYSHLNVGHFGLASRCYTHFTSPIRRYPDLVVHRILRELLDRKKLSDRRLKELEGALPDMAFHSSRMERVSDDAERDVVEAMRMWFMKDKVGEELEGKVVRATPYGVRVRFDDFYVEGFLHVSSLTDDFYVYDDRAMTLRGRHTGKSFGIGSRLRARVDRVDIEGREIVLGV